jgi:integrase
MSVYKRKGSPFYQYEFEIDGDLYRGSTRTANKSEARKIAKQEKEEKLAELKHATSQKASGTMPFGNAADRYFHEVGQHLKGEINPKTGMTPAAENCLRDLNRLKQYVAKELGASALVTGVDDDFITKLVSWRRGQRVTRLRRVKGKKELQQDPKAPFVANATVNRSTTEVMQKVLTRARDFWSVSFAKWPKWDRHMLEEPKERVRELHEGEGETLMDAYRDDYAPYFEFIHMTGWRPGAAMRLRKDEINWGAKTITKEGHGGKQNAPVKITDAIRALLWPLMANPTEFIFTYVAQRTVPKRELVKGKHYPLTESGLKTYFRRVRKRVGLDGGKVRFRRYDYRHDFATKLLREERDLKKVSVGMGHAGVASTLKYAHVLDEAVHEMVERHALNVPRKKRDPESPAKVPHTRAKEAKKPLRRKGNLR